MTRGSRPGQDEGTASAEPTVEETPRPVWLERSRPGGDGEGAVDGWRGRLGRAQPREELGSILRAVKGFKQETDMICFRVAFVFLISVATM